MISVAHMSAIGTATAAETYSNSILPRGREPTRPRRLPLATLPEARLPVQAVANRGNERHGVSGSGDAQPLGEPTAAHLHDEGAERGPEDAVVVVVDRHDGRRGHAFDQVAALLVVEGHQHAQHP